VLRAGGVGGDERQVDVILLRTRKRDLGLLGLLFDALQGVRLFAEVHGVLALNSSSTSQ